MVPYEAVIVAIFIAYAVLAGEQKSVKIVNSTNIRELKLTVPDEDKTGAVAYVYAIESTDLSSTEGTTTTAAPSEAEIRPPEVELHPVTREKAENKRKCVTRVIEKMKGDERTVTYSATAEEAITAGKKIVDTICEGDEKFDTISKQNLANLEDDIYHLP